MKTIDLSVGSLILFFSLNIFAQESVLTQLNLNQNMDLFSEIPEFKKRKDTCLKLIKDQSFKGDLPNCVLKGTGDNQVPPLSEEEISKLGQKLKSKVGPQFEGKQLYEIQNKHDAAIKKLGDFYFNRLHENLYGKPDPKDPLAWSKKRYVEHSTFYEIYKNQVSKNLIEALSSYCIEADKEKSFIISIKKEEREKIREKNISNLETIYDQGQKATSQAYEDWELCIKGIQHICYKTTYEDKKNKIKFDYSKEIGESKIDQEYSHRRACMVMDYLKGARQTILKVTEIQKLMNYVDGSSKKRVDWFKDIAGFDLFSDTGTTIDSMTGITSGELKKSEMEKENIEIVKTLQEKCVKNPDLLECQELIFSDKEKTYQMASEIALKTEAMLEKIEKMTDKELKTYLREQGYSEEKISELEKYKNELKTEIIDRYKAEQEVLITQLALKIEDKTLIKKPPEKQKEKIDKIIEELSSRPREFSQLIHFNNIISGYFTVTEGKNTYKNFQNIFRELSDKGEDKKDLDPKEKARLDNLRKELAGHSISASQEKKDPRAITVDTLNQAILNYQVEKMAERPIQGWNKDDVFELESM